MGNPGGCRSRTGGQKKRQGIQTTIQNERVSGESKRIHDIQKNQKNAGDSREPGEPRRTQENHGNHENLENKENKENKEIHGDTRRYERTRRYKGNKSMVVDGGEPDCHETGKITIAVQSLGLFHFL